jgi:hypothetical protein
MEALRASVEAAGKRSRATPKKKAAPPKRAAASSRK